MRCTNVVIMVKAVLQAVMAARAGRDVTDRVRAGFRAAGGALHRIEDAFVSAFAKQAGNHVVAVEKQRCFDRKVVVDFIKDKFAVAVALDGIAEQVCAEQGVPCVLSEVFAKGGEGGKALAEKVLEVMEDRPIQYVYPLEMPLKQKVEAIAKKIYRADGVNFSAAASKTLAELTELGYGDLPVCIAKTQYSFSDNAKLTGAPTGFTMEVREVRLAAGAGFVVVICGNIMTMPGLPKKPAAVNIDVDAEGKITGLF